MATILRTATSNSIGNTYQVGTNKVRIAVSDANTDAPGSVLVAVGNSQGAANGANVLTLPIVNSTERSWYVGQGNWIGFYKLSTASNTQVVTITELGAPVANTAYTNGNTII